MRNIFKKNPYSELDFATHLRIIALNSYLINNQTTNTFDNHITITSNCDQPFTKEDKEFGIFLISVFFDEKKVMDFFYSNNIERYKKTVDSNMFDKRDYIVTTTMAQNSDDLNQPIWKIHYNEPLNPWVKESIHSEAVYIISDITDKTIYQKKFSIKR